MLLTLSSIEAPLRHVENVVGGNVEIVAGRVAPADGELVDLDILTVLLGSNASSERRRNERQPLGQFRVADHAAQQAHLSLQILHPMKGSGQTSFKAITTSTTPSTS